MASGFMSSVVQRLFHGKHKQGSPRSSVSATPRTHHPLLSSSLSSPTLSSSSPSPALSSGGQTQEDIHPGGRENGRLAQGDGAKKRVRAKKKPALFSSLRRKTRPLSCIAARPDSPTEFQTDSQSQPLPSKTSKQRGKVSKQQEEEEKSGRQQRKEKKKPRRPLSCIVQPPSPRLLPSAEASPRLLSSATDRETDPGRREGSHSSARIQAKPRPVSCFVEPPPDRSPPPYCRRPQGWSPQVTRPVDQYNPQPVEQYVPQPAGQYIPEPSDQYIPQPADQCVPQPADQYVPFQVGSPQRSPPSYLEASRRSPRLSPLTQQPLSVAEAQSREPLPYQQQSSLQPESRYTDKGPLNQYSQQPQDPPLSCPESRPQPGPYPLQTPALSIPALGTSRPPQRPGRCGDVNCVLNPCPYRLPTQSPGGYSGYSYDLKSCFPPASPARRYGRPQSACFLCQTQPCCLEAPRPCRPRSQCYFPECDLPWLGPDPNLKAEHQLQPAPRRGSSEGDPNAPAQESMPWTQPATSSPVDIKTPTPTSPMETSSPAPSILDSARPPPRPAKRTLGPRPLSTCVLSTESDYSPLSSPAPSPCPRRFPMKKYRSADCLDRVDELDNLAVSPPPAKPLSYFTNPDPRQPAASTDKHGEIFTSADMLEKLGQPRSGRHQPRPVSCFVGSSADESGYLSNAPLGGGWVGGLSVSTGDILELLEGDELDAADDELSLERASSLRKAWSVCSLLRQDSIQDRSFTVMRRRRQKMKDRRHHTNQQSSSTDTDEGLGVKEANSASSLPDHGKDGESATVAGIPLDRKQHVAGSRGAVLRLHSAHMKAWQIRLRRKQMMKKRRSTERLEGSRTETLV